MTKEQIFKKEKQKAERLIGKVKRWKVKYNNCAFKDEIKMDLKVIDWRMRAEKHIDELKKMLGNLRVCFDNDSKRLELARILILYKEELNLEVSDTTHLNEEPKNV